MEWWVIPVITMGSAILGVAIAAIMMLLGGWMVFRTKAMNSQAPFFQPGSKKQKASSSYTDLFSDQEETIYDETLSPAAARLRDQKSNVEDLDEHKLFKKKIGVK